MLHVREFDDDEWFVVKNNAGSVLIYTTSSAIAYFVNHFTPKLDVNLRLTVGGDPGTRNTDSNTKIFHHVRRYRY